jgi:phosphoglycolate phosphatase
VLKSVIFDLDGTLVDSVPGIQWSVEAALRACGMSDICPDLTPLIGPPIRDIMAVATGTTKPATLDLLERAFRAAYDTDGWQRTRCQPGVPEMLGQLRSSGRILSIVTNKPAHAAGLILTHLAIRGCFREIVCRDSVRPPWASKTAMLNDLIDRQAIPRRECIMVGDTLEDCHAAAAAGIACGVVLHGYGRGIAGDLPAGCRRIAGWSELLSWCTDAGFTKDSQTEICSNEGMRRTEIQYD